MYSLRPHLLRCVKNRNLHMRFLLALLGQSLLKCPQLLLYMEKKKNQRNGNSLRCLTLIFDFGYLQPLQFVLVPVLRGLGGFLALIVVLVVSFSLLLVVNSSMLSCVLQMPGEAYLELILQEIVISKLISVIQAPNKTR